jgi:hypothetical protein
LIAAVLYLTLIAFRTLSSSPYLGRRRLRYSRSQAAVRSRVEFALAITRKTVSGRLSIKRLLKELDELEAKTGKTDHELDPPRTRADEVWDARLRRMQERTAATTISLRH